MQMSKIQKRIATIFKLEELNNILKKFSINEIRLFNLDIQIFKLNNIGTIFKVTAGNNEAIVFFNKITTFVNLIQLIITLTREQNITHKKLSIFNTHLKWFQDKLRNNQTFTTELLNISNFIKNMPLFNKNLQFNTVLSESNLEQISDIKLKIPLQCRYERNFDNTPFDMNETPITLSAPMTRGINEELPNSLKKGVCFGVYDKEELYQILTHAIQSNSILDIKIVSKPNYLGYPGGIYYSTERNNFKVWYLITLKIYIRHGETLEAIINSDDTKILNIFSIHVITKTIMSPLILSLTSIPVDIGAIYAINIYKDYHNAVNKRIEELLYIYGKTETALFQVINCRTSTCPIIVIAKNTYSVKSNILCTICKIQYCSLCENLKHNGECIVIDDILTEYLNTNTKKCPNIECNISYEKKDGCNHMRCLSCNTHFCWLCGHSYNLNEITEHYIIDDNIDNIGSFSSKCIGLL
jgi:hypothetical protein